MQITLCGFIRMKRIGSGIRNESCFVRFYVQGDAEPLQNCRGLLHTPESLWDVCSRSLGDFLKKCAEGVPN